MKKLLLIISAICVWHISFSQAVPLDSAKYYVGKTITVCDKVQGTYVTKGESKTTIINFGAPYPNTTFTAVIFAKSMAFFDYIPAEFLMDKDVCITGKVSIYNDKPQIIVENNEQISIQTH